MGVGGGVTPERNIRPRLYLLHLVQEVGMNEGKGWVQTVGEGPHIWSGAHIWKTLGRRGCIWAEGHTQQEGASEGG